MRTSLSTKNDCFVQSSVFCHRPVLKFNYVMSTRNIFIAFDKPNLHRNIVRWHFAFVGKLKGWLNSPAMTSIKEITVLFNFKREPRSLFIAHDLVRATHFSQRGYDDAYGNSAQNKPNNGSISHYLGEGRHLLLCLKVLLGAGMIAGGFYLLMNTVPKGYKLKTETFLINTILGIFYVLLGSLFAVHSFFGLVG